MCNPRHYGTLIQGSIHDVYTLCLEFSVFISFFVSRRQKMLKKMLSRLQIRTNLVSTHAELHNSRWQTSQDKVKGFKPHMMHRQAAIQFHVDLENNNKHFVQTHTIKYTFTCEFSFSNLFSFFR